MQAGLGLGGEGSGRTGSRFVTVQQMEGCMRHGW